jgi:hypothetical protein
MAHPASSLNNKCLKSSKHSAAEKNSNLGWEPKAFCRFSIQLSNFQEYEVFRGNVCITVLGKSDRIQW